jgi:FAD/FMN-containing dehydrogenase/Fe-S oxidoreductase
MSARGPGTDESARLERALAARVAGEVRFDRGARAVYAFDASNYRQVPIGVVVPRSVEDLVAAVEVCRAFGAPILARGGGTSQCGQCVNAAVVLDCSKYLGRVLEVDAGAQTALVEPGTVLDALRAAAAPHGLTFGPDPATHSRCTLGGMIGNNSCGPHSVTAGKTVENVEALEILTYDGTRMWVGATSEEELARILRAGGRRAQIYAALVRLRDRYAERVRAGFPRIKRRVSGYNLDQLLPENGFHVARALVGSEGTCALTLAARVKLVKSPRSRALLVLGFDDICEAADAVPHVMQFGPLAVEGLDEAIVGGMRARGLRLDDLAQLPPGRAWLMVEFGGDSEPEAAQPARALAASFARAPRSPSSRLVSDPALQTRIWTIREIGASATALALDSRERDPQIGWEDAAVDPMRLGDYLRAFRALVSRYGYTSSLYGHFGDGCVHARITFDLRTREGVATWRAFLREAAELVVRYGGSLSGEHGDGQARAELLPAMFGPELMQAFREFKAIWDPHNRMNPGKLVDAYRVDEHLRMGPDYEPWRPATHFSFASREGSGFARAIERCVGMGKCRALSGGVMCPSYRATREERYSTRGRARLLSEMLRGELVRDRWQSEEVREALDLCLSCKGCKSDCPTRTDIASYKAEFLSHYYAGRLRPRQAYSVGLVARWARVAALAPGPVNALLRAPGLAALVRLAAGLARERELPRFAPEPFARSFARRPARAPGAPEVLLWPDTFNNYFEPAVASAAVEVLEAAGWRVRLPPPGLCCGRPLYDFGMLDLAKRALARILERLEPELRAGTPIVVLEPACASVFHDELPNLFPGEERAHRLARQVRLFADFLAHTSWSPAPLGARAIVHGHCHQKALYGMGAEAALLERLGVEHEEPESGCCGMAGAFGLHPDRYRLSLRLAERALAPAVRAAPGETLIVAAGFSCREQIAHTASRRPLHPAQVARLALERAS